MQTCLFTGQELDDNTNWEHTIPRSLGGKIRSKIVSSSKFNQKCSDGVDNILSGAFQPMYNYLNPLLPRELRPGALKVNLKNSPGKYVLKPGGKLESVGCWPVEKDDQGRPTSIEGNEKSALKVAKQMGVHPEKYQRTKLPREPVTIHIPSQYGKEIELAALKSGMLTFDHLLAKEGIRFTRDTSLSEVRSLIRSMIMEDKPAKELFTRHVWGIDYDILERIQQVRERHGEGEPTPFEHILVAMGNAGQRTVDLVWCIFGFEPHRFKLHISSHTRPYNHPDAEVLEKLGTRPFKCYRTDRDYHITFRTDGKGVETKWSHS